MSVLVLLWSKVLHLWLHLFVLLLVLFSWLLMHHPRLLRHCSLLHHLRSNMGLRWRVWDFFLEICHAKIHILLHMLALNLVLASMHLILIIMILNFRMMHQRIASISIHSIKLCWPMIAIIHEIVWAIRTNCIQALKLRIIREICALRHFLSLVQVLSVLTWWKLERSSIWSCRCFWLWLYLLIPFCLVWCRWWMAFQ